VSPLLLANAVFLKNDLPVRSSSDEAWRNARHPLIMSNEILYCHHSKPLHRSTLLKREEKAAFNPKLSQSDLLSSLKALSAM